MKYDSIHGALKYEVMSTAIRSSLPGREIKVPAERDPDCPRDGSGVELVIESSGKVRSRERASFHQPDLDFCSSDVPGCRDISVEDNGHYRNYE